MAWTRYKLDRLVTDRPATEKSSLSWLQREVAPFLTTARKVLNWAVDYLGLVQVDADQTPVILETALAAGAGVSVTKTGATPNKKLTIASTGGVGIYDPIPYFPGVLTSNAAIWGVKAPHAASFPANFTGSYANAKVASTAECILTIKKNGASVGTVTFAAAGTTGTFAAASPVSLAAGDLFEIWTPAIADATLAYVTVSMKGAQA